MLITNGNEEKNVTRGAYKQFYMHLGYKPIVVIEPTFTEKIVEEHQEKPVEVKEEKIEKKIVSQKNTPKKSKK